MPKAMARYSFAVIALSKRRDAARLRVQSAFIRFLSCLAGALLLSACGSSSSDEPAPDPSSSSSSSESSSSSSSSGPTGEARIQVNQVGFLPQAQKLAVVPDNGETNFAIIEIGSEDEVFTGELSEAAHWAPTVAEGATEKPKVRVADFSGLTVEGEYRVRVEGLDDSPAFIIDADAYHDLNVASLKAYYFNRASTALEPEHAGVYARDKGHPDDSVLFHPSADAAAYDGKEVINAAKGWYDAGDFGKYVVNSGISTYTLLAAYEHFPDYYENQNLNIPESGDSLPDILAEAKWNLDWMLTMQDDDGGVYHKLTTLNFAGIIMPHEADETDAPRYVIGKSTSATLNFAAVMAQASRIWENRDDGLATEMLNAAKDAWAWAEKNDAVRYNQSEMNEDLEEDLRVYTGPYGGNDLKSNRAWAATELFITTGNNDYLLKANLDEVWESVPGWPNSSGLVWMSLGHYLNRLSEDNQSLVESRLTKLADNLANQTENSAYRVPMSDFYWGSNSNALNRAMMLLQAYRLDPSQERYRDAAQSLLDYILGRNPTHYSFVTGHGDQTPMYIHHRVSAADSITEPVPGFVVGGPNPQNQDDCEGQGIDYPSDAPAKSYIDDWCSYSTNEVTINWNAPLVYVSGALQALSEVE